MDRFIDRIYQYVPMLAAQLFGTPGVGPDEAGPLVVVDARELFESLSLDLWLGLQEPTACSPGSRRVFVEFGRVHFDVDPDRPEVHGWLFAGRGPRPGVFEQVRASLVVEHDPGCIGLELLVDLDLDEAGRLIGWPAVPLYRWRTPSSKRVIGDDPIIIPLYPALVALERLNAEGDSIRAHTPVPDRGRAARGLPPLFPHVIPSPRPDWPRPSYVMQ